MTEISDILTEKLEKQAQLMQEDETASVNEDIPDLQAFFQVGQIVRCIITQLEEEERYSRVELSLRSSLINKDLTLDVMSPGMLLTGCVKSKEDHGYVISFGTSDKSTGFLPLKQTEGKQFVVGQPIECSVVSINKATKMLSVTIQSDVLSKGIASEKEVLTLESILPGMLCNAKVQKLLPNGLFVTFLGYFAGTVDRLHLSEIVVDANINESKRYKVGQKVKVRVLWINYAEKKIGLSMRPHILQWSPCTFPPSLKVGDIFDEATVK
jgi:rRNA biogenesis protein RRP5